MQYITTTQLRTKSSQLVATLKKGGSVSLIHHSKVIGEIKPKIEAEALTKEAVKELKKLAEQLNLPKTSYKEREISYRKQLTEKYGQGLS